MDSINKDKKIVVDEDLYFAILIFMKKLEMKQVKWLTCDKVNKIFSTQIINIGLKIYLKDKDFSSIQFELYDKDNKLLYVFNNSNCQSLFQHHCLDCGQMWSMICEQNGV